MISLFKSGIGEILVYVIGSSCREVFFSKFLKQVDFYYIVFICFGFTSIFFVIFNNKLFTKKNKLLLENISDVIGINLTTALMWSTFIFSLKFIEPGTAATIAYSIGPISTLLMAIKWLDQRPEKIDYFSAIGVLISVIYIIFFTLSDNKNNFRSLSFGITLAVVSGLITAINRIFTKRLYNKNFNSSDIMAIRFIGLVIFSAAGISINHVSLNADFKTLFSVVSLAFLCTVIPLYCLQLGIKKSDIRIVALVVAVGPLLTFYLNSIVNDVKFSLSILIGILFTLAFVNLGVFFRLKKDQIK